MFLATVLALSVSSAGRSHAEARDGDQGPLPWRANGRVGFSLDAAGFPDSTGTSVELYLRVPPSTLSQLSSESGKSQRLKLTARMRDSFGRAQVTESQEFRIDAADSTEGLGKVVLMRFPGRRGTQRLHIRLEDLESRKRGLAYVGRKVTEATEAEGEFELPKSQAGRDVSDLEFLWSSDSTGRDDAFLRGGRTLLPNPERLYGLYSRHVRAYARARSLPGDDRAWHWIARALDTRGRVVASQESTGVAGRTLEALCSLDFTRQPAGGYDLEFKAWQEGDPGALVRHGRFSIAWQSEAWLRDPSEIEDRAHFLLSAQDEESFDAKPPGEQEAFLDSFWTERDPTPDDGHNEAREAFYQRVESANHQFAAIGRAGRGMYSDMGRVFIRYGEPSEVLKQVVPTGDNTLLQQIEELRMTEDRPMSEVNQKGPGGDMRPFEVWIYEGEIPVPPDADPHVARATHRRRLVFLFVDEQGTGEYTLRYSTE